MMVFHVAPESEEFTGRLWHRALQASKLLRTARGVVQETKDVEACPGTMAGCMKGMVGSVAQLDPEMRFRDP